MNWTQIINPEIEKDYMKAIATVIKERRRVAKVYPADKDIFRAFHMTPFNSVKVVILGQDPYHDGNADGLAFSCKKRISPSLTKMYGKLNKVMPDENAPLTLESWAEQGVLLLNTVLTVEKGAPQFHSDLNWQRFTKVVIKSLIEDVYPKVFLLWGGVAKDNFQEIVYETYGHTDHLPHIFTVRSEHPARASHELRDWMNNDCFNKANKFLEKNNLKPVDWLKLPVVETQPMMA